MANNELQQGHIFDGHYKIGPKIGEGGFSDVYLVTYADDHRQQLYALKLLRSGADVDAMERFKTEAGMLRILKHDHIVKARDVRDHPATGRQPYFVMQYAPYGTVENVLQKRAPQGLPEAEAVGYIEQAGDALQHMHKRQILHRDVKPENMLLGPKHEVLLSDLGLAIFLHDLPVKRREGTPLYMAPEAWGKSPSIHSDQFALAVSTYVLLCGSNRFPFRSRDDILSGAAIPMMNQVQQYSVLLAELEPVLQKGFAKKEEDRYPSVSAYTLALSGVLNDASNERLRPPGTIYPVPKTILAQPVRQIPPTVIAGSSADPGVVGQRAPSPQPAPAVPPVSKAVTRTEQAKSNTQQGRNTRQAPDMTSSSDGESLITRRALLAGVVVTGLAIVTYEVLPHLLSGSKADPQKGGINKALPETPTPKPVREGDVIEVYSHSGLYAYSTYQCGGPALAWSPDGKRIASAGEEGTVRVWDAINGDHEFIYKGHSDYANVYVNGIAWSPDGKRIASASGANSDVGDGTIQIWNATDGSNRLIFKEHSNRNVFGGSNFGIQSVAWSPDGKWIASVGSGPSEDGSYMMDEVLVWDAANGSIRLIYRGHGDRVCNAVWSPNGRQIASSSWGSTIHIWDANNGNLIIEHKFSDYEIPNAPMPVVTWSPNGKWIASGVNYTLLEIWNAASGKVKYTLNRENANQNNADILSVTWSPNGRWIAAALNYKVRIWDTADGHMKFTHQCERTPSQVAWSPDAKYIASGDDNEIRVWIS